MEQELSLQQMQKSWHGNLSSYLIGFTASFLLTSLSFLLVISRAFSAHALLYTISGLALVQAAVQLRYFLHLGKEGRPHWETWVFVSMFSVLLVIVGGTLWIMYDLNQRTMTMP